MPTGTSRSTVNTRKPVAVTTFGCSPTAAWPRTTERCPSGAWTTEKVGAAPGAGAGADVDVVVVDPEADVEVVLAADALAWCSDAFRNALELGWPESLPTTNPPRAMTIAARIASAATEVRRRGAGLVFRE